MKAGNPLQGMALHKTKKKKMNKKKKKMKIIHKSSQT